ncbi:phosphatidylserine decarboxylase [Erythrobacteraceae bacterium CFH 75059]|uniref:archaetidylserine decarboxylase n=1 Tax=Qipengyuania thermophila TaxID=2509361 RepID=UPI001020A974|nr:archaetidylserine decarboxylase [Qipengyuania thermophila]TCD06527.1 phosphatidylserine decarboxylase [Erythrobacteraceae bacterium CFH 75059]
MSLFVWLQHVAPQRALTRIAGRFAASSNARVRHQLIRRFIRAYDVDMEEAERGMEDYRSFNDFFTRALKPGARPLADPARFVLSPADGAVSQLGRITGGRILQAKGREFTAAELLGGDADAARRFAGGEFATIYLSPRDYHRVHMPVSGTLRWTRHVPGRLFSVNTATARGVRGLFARNERLVCVFDTDLGSVAVVMVGAMIVASIKTVWGGLARGGDGKPLTRHYPALGPDSVRLEAGAEMGRFLLGSTVVLLFEPGRIRWRDELGELSVLRMGEAIGERLDAAVSPADDPPGRASS